MNDLKFKLIWLLSCLMLCSCAASPPMCQLVRQNPVLEKSGGVLIVADMCIKLDAIGEEGDYFVVKESKECAQAIVEIAKRILSENEIKVNESFSPFICGVIHDQENDLKNVADCLGDPVKRMSQPFGVNAAISSDKEYIAALSNASTYVYLHGGSVDAKPQAANGTAEGNVETDEKPKDQPNVSEEEFKEAIDLISQRTNASSLLFLNLHGNKISGGKKTAQALGRIFVGLATGIATAGLGTGYYVAVFPGGSQDGHIMGAALVDIETMNLSWTNKISAIGDPVNVENTADEGNLKLLLRGVLHEPVQLLTENN